MTIKIKNLHTTSDIESLSLSEVVDICLNGDLRTIQDAEIIVDTWLASDYAETFESFFKLDVGSDYTSNLTPTPQLRKLLTDALFDTIDNEICQVRFSIDESPTRWLFEHLLNSPVNATLSMNYTSDFNLACLHRFLKPNYFSGFCKYLGFDILYSNQNPEQLVFDKHLVRLNNQDLWSALNELIKAQMSFYLPF